MVKEEPGVTGSGLAAMQAVLDAMPSNIAVLDSAGRILLVNRSWKAFAQANGGANEDVGADYLASVPLEEVELRQGLRDVLAGGSSRSFDYTCDAPDRRRWFRMTATPLDGPAACLVNHVDITETREAEEEARDSAGLFRELFDQTPDPVTLSDFPGGQILLVNPAWSALTGVSLEEAAGRDPAERGVWIDPGSRAAILEELRATGVCTKSMVDLRCRGGDVRRMLLSCTLVDVQGGPKVLMAARDITALQRAQDAEALARKADSLVLMAGSIAHDFNNLFAGLSAGLEIIAMQARSPEDVLQGVATAKAVLNRAVALSWKMNDFSGQGIVRMARLELGDLLRRWAPASSARHGGRAPVLELEMAAPVMADAARLEAALDAIVANAWEAMDDAGVAGGRVRARLFMDRGEDGPAGGEGLWAAERPAGAWTVCLEIANEGPWPDPGVLSRMFDPFFTTHFVGRGLGLASVLGVLQSHGAGIHVLPAPGGGLAFRIHFQAL